MFKKFIESVWFNVILALLAAVLIIMQEVWIGTDMEWLNSFALGACAAFGFAWGASVIKFVAYRSLFNWKHIGIATAVGVVAALITALLTV